MNDSEVIAEAFTGVSAQTKDNIAKLKESMAKQLKVTPEEIGAEIKSVLIPVLRGESDNETWNLLKKKFYDSVNKDRFWSIFLDTFRSSKLRILQDKPTKFTGFVLDSSEGRKNKNFNSGAIEYVYEMLVYGHKADLDEGEEAVDGICVVKHESPNKYPAVKKGKKVNILARLGKKYDIKNECGQFFRFNILEKPEELPEEKDVGLISDEILNKYTPVKVVKTISILANSPANPYLYVGTVYDNPRRAISPKNPDIPYPYALCKMIDDSVEETEGDFGITMMMSPWLARYPKDSYVIGIASIQEPNKDAKAKGRKYSCQGHGMVPVFIPNELEDFDYDKEVKAMKAKSSKSDSQKAQSGISDDIFGDSEGDTKVEQEVVPPTPPATKDKVATPSENADAGDFL